MRVTQALTWAGNCTENYDATVAFFRDVMGLPVSQAGTPTVDTQYARYTVFRAPGDAAFEVFEPKPETRGRFNGPVIAFTVESLDEARHELESHGIELLSEVLDDGRQWRWLYFRAPDGNAYLIQERTGP